MKMKKAMAGSMIVALIIALVFTGVGIKLVQKIDKGTTKGYDKSLCKQSVIWNSKGRIPLVDRQEFNLDCPTKYVTFYKDKYVIESREYTDEKKINCWGATNRKDQECYLNNVNQQITKMLFDCWDQFAAGRIKVLDAWDSNRQCVVCSRFEFSKDVQEAFGSKVNELGFMASEFRDDKDPKKDFTLDEYMRSHKVSEPIARDVSFYQFCMDPIDAFKLPVYDYTLQEPYAIVFTAINQDQAEKLASGAWDYVKEHRLTIPFTDQNINVFYEGEKEQEGEEKEFVNIMQLVKYSEVAAQCDSLA